MGAAIVLGATILGFLALTSASAGPGSSGSASSTAQTTPAGSGPAAPAPGSAASTSAGSTSAGSTSAGSTSAGSPPEWPADPPGLADRLQKSGLEVLRAEGTALHIHQHLDVYVDGTPVPVPAGIGIDASAGILSPIHTHDDSGIIHVESPTVRDFTLGELFDVWGVRLSADCLGELCAGNGSKLQVWVDGQRVSGDPRAVVLSAHQEIVVAFGTDSQAPDPVPSSYPFPTGV